MFLSRNAERTNLKLKKTLILYIFKGETFMVSVFNIKNSSQFVKDKIYIYLAFNPFTAVGAKDHS